MVLTRRGHRGAAAQGARRGAASGRGRSTRRVSAGETRAGAGEPAREQSVHATRTCSTAHARR